MRKLLVLVVFQEVVGCLEIFNEGSMEIVVVRFFGCIVRDERKFYYIQKLKCVVLEIIFILFIEGILFNIFLFIWKL